LTSPATRVRKLSASKLVIAPTPDLPWHKDRQLASTPTPRGVMAPSPVTTTLLFNTISPKVNDKSDDSRLFLR
jgi:hypothetical protein